MQKCYLEVSKDLHLHHLIINERMTVLGLVKLRGMISHVLLAFPLRSVESEQTCKKNQPLVHFTRGLKCGSYSCRTISYPRGEFSLGNLTKILSHVRAPEQGTTKASQMPQEPQHFPSHRLLFWDEPILEHLVPGAPSCFSRIGCIDSLETLLHPSLPLSDSRICNNYCLLAIWVWEANVLSPLELKRAQFLI